MHSTPGEAGWRWWLANSMSACDTAGMTTLSRALRRWEPIRVAATALGLALAVLLAGYGVGVATAQFTLESAGAALALLAVGGSGLLYAWRLEAGASID